MVSNKQWLIDVNLAFTNGYNKALDDFRKRINDFLSDSTDFADFVVTDSAIDCVIDELKKGATNENNNRDTERV